MKTVVITGGSLGIGRAMAERFGKEGWHVIFCYHRHEKEAKEIAEKIHALGGRCDIFCADLKKSDEVLRFSEYALQKSSEIAVLINNAGVSHYGLMGRLSEADYESVMNTNLKSAFLLTNALTPHMVKNHKGRIINISSVWGIVGASTEALYAASKAGMIGMTKSLAKELGPSGITVNCIAPGVIKTPMMAAFDQDTLDALIEETPLMRLGEPTDVSSLAFFLASEEASFITGQVIAVDGGFAIH